MLFPDTNNFRTQNPDRLINFKLSTQRFRSIQNEIIFDSDEDEGAAEYYGEVQSVVDALTIEGATTESVEKAADWVGLALELVYL